MEKKPEVDGKWVDIEADKIIENIERIGDCEILAVRSLRIEIGGDEKDKFEQKLKSCVEKYSEEMEGMDDEQKSFYILRKMVID